MKALLTAFSKAQADFASVKKDAKNPAYKSSYASLSSVQDATFEALAKHGLCVLQSAHTSIDEQGRLTVYVGALLYHLESGEQIEQLLGLPVTKADPQGVGSAITYGRRYVLMTLLGLVPDDDDGNAATQRPQPQQSYQRPPAPAPAKPAPAPDDRLPDGDDEEFMVDVKQRPRWKSTPEAKAWAREFGVFAAERHMDNAYNKVAEAAGVVKGKAVTDEIIQRTFDAWFVDVMKRSAAREHPLSAAQPALDGVGTQPVYN